MRLEHGKISNPYDKDKEKKEKKKSKDVFQHLIERIFVIAEEKLWNQRNLDRHQPSNKSSYREVIKVDQEIRKLYGLYDEVRPADRDDFYSLDIEQRLSQTIHEKRKWIIRWRDTIHSSIKRNKIKAATDNPIWSYYNRKTEPEVKIDVIAQRRNKRHKTELRRQRSISLRDITAKNRIHSYRKETINKPTQTSPTATT